MEEKPKYQVRISGDLIPFTFESTHCICEMPLPYWPRLGVNVCATCRKPVRKKLGEA